MSSSHDLRHTIASLALEAGVDLKVVSEWLGHAKTSITADLYTHVMPRVGRDAPDRIAGVPVPADPGDPGGTDAFPSAAHP